MFSRGKLLHFIFFRSKSSHAVVEKYVPTTSNIESNTNMLKQLERFVHKHKRLFVLTGAGISTESGIQDYRSEGVGLYARTGFRPVQHQEFLESAQRRKTYWARNFTGWPTFSVLEPNTGHRVLSWLEYIGKVHWIVTQNVDHLHTKAGSKKVTELHGSTRRVICLGCDTTTTREALQISLKNLNPDWNVAPDVATAPDGDVLLNNDLIKDFNVPNCDNCGGILKPDVVFFGGSVPKERATFVEQRLDESDAVLALGTSIQVYSAYRIMLAAHDRGKPTAIVNIGPTRADPLAELKVQVKIGDVVDMLYRSVTNSH